MRIAKKKRRIIIGLLISLAILLLALVVYGVLNNRKSSELLEEPLNLKKFGNSELSVDISDEYESSQDVASVYSIPAKFYKESIEKFMNDLGLTLTENSISDDEHMEWEGYGNRFTYNAISNTLTFQLSKPINLGEEDGAFEKIYLDYFERNYEFVIGQREVANQGLTSYYAKRVVDGIPIEMGYGYEYSDILRFDERGYVIEGNLLLAEVEKKETSVPLISVDELIQYVNLDIYPKESYVYASQLMDTLDLSYLDSRWEEIHSSASNCNSSALELIYLYKSSNQEFLYPTYKVSASCEVQFEEGTYSVPAVFYLNAASPDYIVVE
jgi:hypothetical protein